MVRMACRVELLQVAVIVAVVIELTAVVATLKLATVPPISGDGV